MVPGLVGWLDSFPTILLTSYCSTPDPPGENGFASLIKLVVSKRSRGTLSLTLGDFLIAFSLWTCPVKKKK